MWESILGAVGDAVGGDSGGSSGGHGNTHDVQSGAPILVAPVGLNLGEMLSTFQDGNPQTGGYGLQLLSRLGYGDGSDGTTFKALSFNPLVIIGVVLAGMIILKKVG